MAIKNCRVCGHEFFKGPLLRYVNMPKAAQFLPDAESLERDKGVDLEICQCSGCGLVQLSNDPVPYYKDVIRAAAFSEDVKDYRKKQFGGLIQRFSLGKKKIIEIGCGSGEFLSLLDRFDVNAYGLEHLEQSVAQCVRSGLKVTKGFIERDTYRLNDAPFDAFLMLMFLEHLPDPNAALTGIHNNLADDAIGLVEVPNFDMVLRNKLFAEFIGDHLFYFTRETLNTTLTLNGFEIIECSEERYDYVISAVVRKKGKMNISDFYKYQEKLNDEIKGYVGHFSAKKVAIWGAGHQALAIISLLNLADNIRYVVDSATFKQGKYTPATHVPIVSPAALDSDPVDAVIVMAASYSDEVARIILQKYDKKMKVSILRSNGLEVLVA